MSPQELWLLSVCVAPEAEDAVADLLGRLTGRPPSVCRSVEKQQSTVTVYFDRKTDLTGSMRAAIRWGVKRLSSCGLDIGSGRVSFRPVHRQDWAESWKKHFRCFAVGPRLLVKPSWSRRRAVRGQEVVILDPGLSFGTGQHPTTRFCLAQLVAARKPGTSQSFLDVGTGSGILAIAAAKLGYRPVHGFDLDPDAVRVASENAARNRVQDLFKPWQHDLTQIPVGKRRAYDVICANLLADLLLSSKDRILRSLRPSGRLVIAGILVPEFPVVHQSYVDSGLNLIADAAEGEWRAGCFVRPV